MSTLTIEVDEDLLARAKQLAAAKKMTVAEMLERLLRAVAGVPLKTSELPPITRQAIGMLPPLTDEEAVRILQAERLQKHCEP